MATDVIKAMIDQLNDDDWQERQRAAKTLEGMGPLADDALSVLRITVAGDSDDDVRAAAVAAIASIEKNKSVLLPELVNFLGAGEWEVRQQAAQCLGQLGPGAKEALDALWARVGIDSDLDVRNSVVQALEFIEEDATKLVSKAITLVQSGEEGGSRGGVEVLATIKPTGTQKPEAVNALWELFRVTVEMELLIATFNAIVNATSNQEEVIKTLIDDNRIVPWKKASFVLDGQVISGLEATWLTSRDQIAEIMVQALEIDEVETRERAISWLTGIAIEFPVAERDAVIDRLWRSLRQDGLGFEAICAFEGRDISRDNLLGGGGIPLNIVGRILLNEESNFLDERWQDGAEKANLLEFILPTLQDEDWEVRQKAIRWLGQRSRDIPRASYDEVVPAIEERLRDRDVDVREAADQALIQLRQGTRAHQIGPLLEILKTGDEDAQVEAVEKLADMDTREAFRALIRLWVQWIARGDKNVLADAAEEAMRENPLAVLPLVDQLGQSYQPDDEMKELLDSGTIADAASVAVGTGGIDVLTDSNLDRQVRVQQRIAKQLADMSDPRFFPDDAEETYQIIKSELNRHAVTNLARLLPREEDFEIRENLARTLGNIGGREAVDAIARAIVGEERTRAGRQDLLAKYYLEPSKERSEQASLILNGAVDEARRTVRLLQLLNVAVFLVGLGLMTGGLIISILNEEFSTRLAGALMGLGGFGGLIAQLIRDPLNRIQKAMANLVQIETAFTSFIWELNLNGTYIQSQYVSAGVLKDEEISQTVARIERAMSLAMNLVSVYTEDGNQRILTGITSLFPAAGELGNSIAIRGQHLNGNGNDNNEQAGMVAINHSPVQPGKILWNDDEVRFELPAHLPNWETGERTIWISLFIDGMETNSLPFHVLTA